MSNTTPKMSEFYKDEEELKKANKVLAHMKELRERCSGNMKTIVLRNGVVVSSTSSERLRQYEQHSKRNI